MKKEELFAKTCDELRAIAKEHAIVGRSKMTKDQLVNAITEVLKESVPDATPEEEVQVDTGAKTEYVKTAEKGTIMAFRLPNGKVKSAKMIERSLKREKLKMETAYGRQFVISFSDVIWVKTGDRWPRGVFNLLKGNVNDEGNKQDQ